MWVFYRPSVSKKEGTGVLTLSCFAGIILLIILLHGCSSSEIIAQPLRQTPQESANLAETPQQQTNVTAETPPSPAAAVILDIPRPKIHPQVVQELKEKRRSERIRVLVEAENDEALQKLADAVESAGGTVTQSFSIGNVAVVEIPAEKISEVAQQAGVQEIAPEREYFAFLQDKIPAFSIDTVAWANNLTGSGATIAILDTGIGPHNAVSVALAKSFVSGEDASDQNGHGTHVAGIAQGVAPGARLLNAKVLGSSGSGTTSAIIAGINWAVDPDGNPATDDGADIISMSFGGMFTELDGPLASTVKEAISRGVVFVAAAGNCRQGCNGFFGVVTPANLKDVIAVGAVDDNNVVASFSSGDTFDGYIKPDITAPGVDITSAWLNNSQKTLSGTSMSAPFAAGVITLLLEKEPGLSNGEIKSRLESTADDLGDEGKDESYGSGIINVGKLLKETEPIEITSPPVQNITAPLRPSTGLKLSEIPAVNLTKFTILEEGEHYGIYQYNDENGRNVSFTFHLTKRINESNISAQIIMPLEVYPCDIVPVTMEFDVDDAPSDPPEYLLFEVTDSNGNRVVTPQLFILLPSFIDLLYNSGPGYIITVDTTFISPTKFGTYFAYPTIWDKDGFEPAMTDIDVYEYFNVDSYSDWSDECNSDTDCSSDRWDGGKFCKNGNVYRDRKDWRCVEPSTTYSYCTYDIYPKKIEDCDTGTCSNGACIPECIDADGDGEGTAFPCPFFSDCDDSNPLINHWATEICNNIDDNCANGVDEGCNGKPCSSNSQCKSNVCYSGTCIPPCPDSDQDGYGGSYSPVCTNPGIDCNDGNKFVNPGAAEWCDDDVDNNCNGLIDENCPCSKSANCAEDMRCKFVATTGTCQPATCENECAVENVATCSGTAIYQCINSDNDPCLENTYITNCGSTTICEDGKSACQPKPNVQIVLEETQLPIYAQAGDKITAYLTATSTQSAQLVYSTTAFTLETPSCSGTFKFSGKKDCLFTVKETAPPKAHWIGVKYGPSRKVTVITKPNVLIATHKPMLYERFNSASAVTKLLKQTYDYAYNERGVVYDLADYNLPPHPFDNQPYTETYDDQDMKDNTFAIEAGAFIKDRCNGCTSTLILGDDFVVPHYRRDLDKSFFFGLSKETDEVYSDISYIGRTNLQFSEFEEIFYQKEKFDGKKVMLILPDEVTPAQRTQIDRLTDFIEDDNGPINGKIIDELQASDTFCNSHLAFTYYDGYTLIIIGTSLTNKALQCFPFVIENDLESVTIERNPWDGRAYSVVINSDNADQIAVLNDLLETGAYKELHSSGWLIARTAGNVAAGAAVGLVILGSGGSAAPVMLVVASGLSIAADSVDGAECLEFGAGECTEFVIGLALPFSLEKIGKPLLKQAIDLFGSRLKYVYEALGEKTTGILKGMNKKGQLLPGGGLSKLDKFLANNDFVGNSLIKGLYEHLYKYGSGFTDFIIKTADTNPAKAVGILKVVHETKLTQGQVDVIVKKGYLPTKEFVKSISNLGDEYAYIVDDVLYYSNGKNRPAFRGLTIKNLPDNPKDAARAIDSQLRLDDAQAGYDVPKQVGTGYHSDQTVVSFSHDFGIASGFYSLRLGSDSGVVIVYDKASASFVDSQAILKQLDEKIPFANVFGPNIPVESVYMAALNNNELSLLGKPSIKHVVGWYKITKTADGTVAKKFVQNPEYIGKQSDWMQINTVDKIKQLHNANEIANYQKVVDEVKSRGFDDEMLPDFDLRRGNTAFWPKEVN